MAIGHTIRLAKYSEWSTLMTFIRDHWRSDHIYAIDKAFFEYEFRVGEKLNFAVAYNENGILDGLCGFIDYNPDGLVKDIFTSMWIVRKGNRNPMLGVLLVKFLVNECGFRSVSSVGCNEETMPIYKRLGYQTGKLKHYYLLNSNYRNAELTFKLNLNYKNIHNSQLNINQRKLIKVTSANSLDTFKSLDSNDMPNKPMSYVVKRYFNHPFYNYLMYTSERMDILIVAREQEYESNVILRIVDVIGNKQDFGFMYQAFQGILENSSYIYIDLHQIGIPDGYLVNSGFKLVQVNEIVPNYFDPFVPVNVELNYFTTYTGEYCFYRGDGDQDRPNRFTEWRKL